MRINVHTLREVGDVAQDCDLTKINEAINQAIEFDLSEALCSLFFDVEEFLRDVQKTPTEEINNILEKHYFDDCNGKRYHLGIIHIGSLFAYARYVQINAYHDSHSGLTAKSADWANFVNGKELSNYANPYFQQAKVALEGLYSYICSNRENYKRFDFSKCVNTCGCSGACNGNNSNTREGFISKVIKTKRQIF